MAFRQKVQQHRSEGIIYFLKHLRYYNSKVDWTKLRPMVLEKIKNRDKNYHVWSMIPVAYEVLKARAVLTEGVSTLLKDFPIKSCKLCPEVHIGDTGHQIKTCHGFKRIVKNRVHQWTDGNLNDILVQLETYHHENMFQDIIGYDQLFEYGRIPAVIELCHQAGAKISIKDLDPCRKILDSSKADGGGTVSLLQKELSLVAQRTLEAWETVRLGVKDLLLVCPAKVCKYCSDVHVGSSECKVRFYEVLNRSCRGSHQWKKAEVDDLVPPKLVWHRRPHDPPVLVDSGRGFYGHAPAVVELCVQAGARAPPKYSCMMKSLGLTRT